MNKDINKKINEKIDKKKMKMKSKSYFLAVSILYIISIIVTALFALFLASFIFFALKSSGTNYLLDFGLSGLLPYLKSLPWLLIIALIFLIVLVELFSKKIDLVSKKPLIYSFAALIIVVVGFGAVFANTNIHHRLLDQAVENRLPIGRGLYQKYGTFRENDLIVARIIEINDQYLIVSSQDIEYKINLTDDIHIPSRIEFFEGQEILIFGEIDEDLIRAVGIRPFNGPKPRYKGKKSFINSLKNTPKNYSI